MIFVILGAPGSGKGTRCKILNEKLGIAHISTGELIREDKELYDKYKEKIEKGYLISDQEISKVLRNYLKKIDCNKGCIIDGYPRTIKQAQILEEILSNLNKKLDKVFVIDTEYSVIKSRIANRMVCSNCSKIYNKEYATNNDNKCEYCGSELVLRKDDSEETLKNRIKEYENNIGEIKQYYSQKGLLQIISGSEQPELLLERIKND